MFDEQSQIITFKISVRAELQADGEIDDVQVGRSTCEAAVGSGTGARFAGVVTGPADSNLVGKGTRWAATYTSTVNRKPLAPELHKCACWYHLLVQAVVTAGNALCGSTAIAAGGVALGIAGVQDLLVAIPRFGRRYQLSSRGGKSKGFSRRAASNRCGHILTVQCSCCRFRIGASAAKDVLIVEVTGKAISIEVPTLVGRLANVRGRWEEERIGAAWAAQLGTAVQQLGLEPHGLSGSAIEYQLPLGQDARLIDAPASAVDHLQCPATLRLLAPKVNTQEGPVIEVGLDDVARPLKQQGTGGAHR